MNRGAHAVQFYADDDALLDLLTGYVGSALVRGEAAAVIATPTHRRGLARWLKARCFDLSAAERQGRYISLDARETLDRITEDGEPSEKRLREVVNEVLTAAGRRVGSQRRHLSIFGEMVALLWAQGRRDAALALEGMWNALGETDTFSLCCAYPIGGFCNHSDAAAFLKICSQHSHLFPTDRRAAQSHPQFF